MQLAELLKQPDTLPTVPELAGYLIESFNRDEVDVGEVSHHISTDPVLAAKVLRQANSAFFGLSRQASTVKDAILLLGITRVRALVLGAIMDKSFPKVPGVVLEQFWRYSFNTANLARYVALQVDIDLNVAFTVGMVHAIGELMMHVGMPAEMAKLNATVAPLAIKRAKQEKEAIGYTYADAGAALAKSWHFPKPMVAAIEHQRAPFDNNLYEPMAGVIHMASWRARASELNQTRDDLIHTYPDEVAELLRLDPDLLMDEFEGVLERA